MAANPVGLDHAFPVKALNNCTSVALHQTTTIAAHTSSSGETTAGNPDEDYRDLIH